MCNYLRRKSWDTVCKCYDYILYIVYTFSGMEFFILFFFFVISMKLYAFLMALVDGFYNSKLYTVEYLK